MSTSAAQNAAGKLVCVKGTALLIADADGNDTREIAADGEAKSMPRWSPDGTMIAYLAPGFRREPAAARGVIKIVGGDGRRVGTAPVYSVEPDGIEVIGLRLIDDIGWHSDHAVYAIGSAGPRMDEYRFISFGGKTLGGTLGVGFAVCTGASKVATLQLDGLSADEYSIDVDEKKIYAASPGARIRNLTLMWSEDCQRLVFIEARGRSQVVVWADGAVESRMTLPASDGEAEPIKFEGKMAVVDGSVAFAYEPSKKVWRQAPDLAEAYAAREAARAELVEHLGCTAPQWWTPGQQ